MKDPEISLVFQVVSVKRITEQGNWVSFGPKPEDNFIGNRATGQKVQLRKTAKGSYVLDVRFVGGGTTCVTVDSGAKTVCVHGIGDNSLKSPRLGIG